MSRTAAAAGSLTFGWDQVRELAGTLPRFLTLSLAAHALSFLLFQIAYPERATISEPAPTVSLLDPRRAEHQALLGVIEAEDPAPAVSAQSTVPEQLLAVPYRPSYATARTPLKTLPEPVATVQFPPARDPLAIIRSGSPRTADRPRAPARALTHWRLGEELASRALRRDFVISFSQPARIPLTPARFLIGVTDTGEVRFSFLLSSSGDARADELAAVAIERAAFAPADAPMTWSQAAVMWGDDVYAPAIPGASP